MSLTLATAIQAFLETLDPPLSPQSAISAVTHVGTTITATVASTSGMRAGQGITVAGIIGFTTNNPNGSWKIATVPDSTHITFLAAAAPTGSYGSGGVVTVKRPPVFTLLPLSQQMHYILVHDDIANPRDPTAAPHAVGGRKGVLTEVQVDVWQHIWSDPDSNGKRTQVYDPLLPHLVASALDGARLPAIPGRVYGCSLLDGPREIPNPNEANVKHHVIQLQAPRDLVTARP